MKAKSSILIFIILLIKTLSKDKIEIATPIPKNGTFVISEFSDSTCSILTKMRGFIPEAEKWNQPTNYISEMKLINYTNSTGNLIYQDSNSQNQTIKCDNSCINTNNNNIYYTCHYIQAYNLSKFTFKAFSDSGCNNINGKSYVNTLSDSCWNLDGDGSMTVVNFIDRLLVYDVFSSNNCTGKKTTSSFECNEKCIDNPINDKKVHYTCKFEYGFCLSYSFYYLFLILFVI